MPSNPDTPGAASAPTSRRLWRWLLGLPLAVLGLVLLLLLGPLGVVASGGVDLNGNWRTADRGSVGLAPDPRREAAAVVQVYGARTVNWRGAFGIHPGIAVKRAGEAEYTTYQVLGWRTLRGLSNVVQARTVEPDGRWFGAMPMLLADHRGATAEAMIGRIEAAVASYPWGERYRVWPGPNSNSFAAHVARAVPELRLDLPPNALGKDYLGETTFIARAPSGTGWQWSVFGLLGVTAAVEEGLELNLLGLSVGVDFNDLALRLPGVGRVRLAGS